MLLALRQLGSVLGIAVLGSLLTVGYHAGLPAGVDPAISRSPTAGVAVAQQLGSPALAQQVREAFTGGLTLTLGACAVVAVLGVALSLSGWRRSSVSAQPALPPASRTADLSTAGQRGRRTS